MRLRAQWRMFVLVSLIAACCKTHLDLEAFERAPLQSQMTLYNNEVHARCVSHPATYLFIIAQHGEAAADADGFPAFTVKLSAKMR